MLKVYHKIIRIAGSVITVEADNVAYNELAEVTGERGVSLVFYRVDEFATVGVCESFDADFSGGDAFRKADGSV